jgi:hypothetical protein
MGAVGRKRIVFRRSGFTIAKLGGMLPETGRTANTGFY